MGCGWTSYVWFELANLRLDSRSASSLDRWIEGIVYSDGVTASVRSELLAKIAFICWFIWEGRNKALQKVEDPQMDVMISRCRRAMNEFAEAQRMSRRIFFL